MESPITSNKTTAYIAPMAVFLGFLALTSGIEAVGGASAKYWVYPIQTIVCACVVAVYYREYDLGTPRRVWIAASVAVLVFIIWISPQAFGAAPRTQGYDPAVFGDRQALYWPNLALRFLRLVVVVPFVEEIFWRGFLLRYLIRNDFATVPFGSFSWLSFSVVSVAFMFTHATPDWPAALICGALYNGVAYWTKSLTSCIAAHAITNLLLGLWIMETRQWGFW